mmetsp:Transcript_30032/g.33546  ORF Transcript_30032/g.33546 Transcript_30032/m.33546 type:complete len:122 (-) Transcript_30032:320-685(-)
MTEHKKEAPIATPDSHVLSSLRVTIIKTQWNASLIDPLAERVENKLVSCGVPADFITVVKAPGAYELPYTASLVAKKNKEFPFPTVIICLGVLIKGETMHFEYISQAVTQVRPQIKPRAVI